MCLQYCGIDPQSNNMIWVLFSLIYVFIIVVVIVFLGWATAELVMTRLLPLWVGARGVEFDWKYIQMSFDANVSLVRVD